ncbi:hypothetical protein DRZ77_01080 [Candidatus Woesearchaeota archaeon]|nr:hypothetical protein [Candidatus Woesearchaeota archaeon]RLE40814.1 MAG: hypothetical protein DRZ77_01080 [Candidatus Woesearchaeota archaeon]
MSLEKYVGAAVFGGAAVALVGCNIPIKEQIAREISEKGVYRFAGRSESVAENYIKNAGDMFSDGKVSVREYNNLQRMEKELEVRLELLTELESEAGKQKQDAKKGMLGRTKKVVEEAYNLMKKIDEHIQKRMKAKCYVGFNLMNGKGLRKNRETLEKYSAEVNLSELERQLGCKPEARWIRLDYGNDFLNWYRNHVSNEGARKILNYLLNRNMIDPTSVNVRAVYKETAVQLTSELKNEIKQFLEKYAPVPEQQQKKEQIKKEQRKQAMKKQTPPKNTNKKQKPAIQRKVPR